MAEISFNVTKLEAQTIHRIAARYDEWLLRNTGDRPSRMSVSMDLTACHANGCPLRLSKLLNADDFDFIHDVVGIIAHLDRQTGQLDGRFLPRCARPERGGDDGE